MGRTVGTQGMLTALLKTDGSIAYFQRQSFNSPALAVSCNNLGYAYVGGETTNVALGSGTGTNVYVVKNRIEDGVCMWAVGVRQTSVGWSNTESLVSLEGSWDGYYVYVVF